MTKEFINHHKHIKPLFRLSEKEIKQAMEDLEKDVTWSIGYWKAKKQ